MLLSLFFWGQNAKASHYIGGDMTYVCTTNNTYAFTLILYRDCAPGNATFFDMNFEVFNSVTLESVQASANIEPDLIEPVDLTGVNFDPCVDFPEGVCVEKATYTFVTTLPPSLDGYLISSQSCCLANTVLNVDLGGGFGGTGILVSSSIPPVGNGNPICFDSPLFNEDPPPYLCLYELLNVDLGAHLANPDPTITLVHSLYHPEYEAALDPPYDLITYNAPYTYDAPVSSVSGLDLDPNTGILTGIIDEIGFFYIGVRVFAVKNGDTIATIERPFRYNISDCNINRSEMELATAVECGNLNVDFNNLSFGADNYEWNFDDPESGDNNTTTLLNPSHTFTSFGTYNVMLVTLANNDVSCSDTSFLSVVIDSAVTSIIEVNNDYQCLAANSFNFTAVSESTDGVSYDWDFGPTASQTSSTGGSVNGISYTEPGIYEIKLTTHYKECSSETTMNVEVFDGLLAAITGPTEGCAPFDAVFEPSVDNPNFTYTWRCNNRVQVSKNGEFKLTNPGVYSVELYVIDENGCESTDYNSTYIEIYEVPETGFTISDYKISVGETIEIENTVEGDYEIIFNISSKDFEDVKTHDSFGFTVYEEGQIAVVQTVINNDICISEETQIVNVGPPEVDPPNVFTPNNDGVNDFFYIEPFNNENIEFKVFDRWGLLVFSSDNYERCNPETGEFCWDGNDVNGNKVISGVYPYIVNLSNGFVKQGVINVF